jgi:hypothetical protein
MCEEIVLFNVIKMVIYLDGVPMTTKEKKLQMRCRVKGRVKNNAVLRAGMISGDLTPHPGIKRIKPCVKKCCQDVKCEVAVMLEDKCYSVRCVNKEYCQSRPAPLSAYSKKPRLAFVERENLYKGKKWIFSSYSDYSEKLDLNTVPNSPFFRNGKAVSDGMVRRWDYKNNQKAIFRSLDRN